LLYLFYFSLSCLPLSHCFTAYTYWGMYKSSAPDRRTMVHNFLCTLSVELASCLPSGAYNFEVVPWFSEKISARHPTLCVFIHLLLFLYPTFPTPFVPFLLLTFTPKPSDLSGLKP
jgi:hypothetical protein